MISIPLPYSILYVTRLDVGQKKKFTFFVSCHCYSNFVRVHPISLTFHIGKQTVIIFYCQSRVADVITVFTTVILFVHLT